MRILVIFSNGLHIVLLYLLLGMHTNVTMEFILTCLIWYLLLNDAKLVSNRLSGYSPVVGACLVCRRPSAFLILNTNRKSAVWVAKAWWYSPGVSALASLGQED